MSYLSHCDVDNQETTERLKYSVSFVAHHLNANIDLWKIDWPSPQNAVFVETDSFFNDDHNYLCQSCKL